MTTTNESQRAVVLVIDVLGIAKTQGDRLGREYLDQWAEELGVADLIKRALSR